MIATRVASLLIPALLCIAGAASAQYGYSVQGPSPGVSPGGAPQYTPPASSPYASSGSYYQQQTFDPNMGMAAPTSYGGPSYTGQQNYPGQPAPAASVGGGMLTYGQLEVDYLRTTHDNKSLGASDGVGISLMTQLFHPFFLHFGVDFSSGNDKTFSAKNYDFSTITLGGGGYFAITPRFHLVGEIGFLYANLDASKNSLSFSDGAVYIKPSLRFAATDSLELDGGLTATSADKYDSFVFDLGGYYKIFSQMDLGLNVGFGDQTTSYRAGVRFRW